MLLFWPAGFIPPPIIEILMIYFFQYGSFGGRVCKCQINEMRDSKRRRHLKTVWPWLNPYSISDSNHLQTKPCKLETWRNIDDIMITTWCLEAAHHNHTKHLHGMERLVLIRCKSSKNISCTKHLTWKCFQQWGYSLGLITAMGHQSYHQLPAPIGF